MILNPFDVCQFITYIQICAIAGLWTPPQFGPFVHDDFYGRFFQALFETFLL